MVRQVILLLKLREQMHKPIQVAVVEVAVTTVQPLLLKHLVALAS
jgi:hypothetical protein